MTEANAVDQKGIQNRSIENRGLTDQKSRRRLAEMIVESGTPLKHSVEITHWKSEEEKQEFIRNYIDYAQSSPSFRKQYEDAISTYARPTNTPQYLLDYAHAPRLPTLLSYREPLVPESGTDYSKDPTYIDNITGAEYDVLSGQLIIYHAYDGSRISLDLEKILEDLQFNVRGIRMAQLEVFYWRDKSNGKIYPNKYSRTNTPKIVERAEQAREAKPYAERLGKLGTKIPEEGLIQTKLPKLKGPKVIPKLKVQPFNGTVNVGGATEEAAYRATNLNALKDRGPAGIPNLVVGHSNDIGKIFEAGSVVKLISNKLPVSTVNWPKFAIGAHKVMQPGGKVSMNIWTTGKIDHKIILDAFKAAGFKDVRILGEGSYTILMGIR